MFVVGGGEVKIVDFYADDISRTKLWTFTWTTFNKISNVLLKIVDFYSHFFKIMDLIWKIVDFYA
jgi:hypothetical protein